MRKSQVGAAASSAVLLTTLVGQNAWAVGSVAQPSICATYQNNYVAMDTAVNHDPAVKAAQGALAYGRLAYFKALDAERAARKVLIQAKASKKQSAIAKALAHYNATHAARLAAFKVAVQRQARADYVRAMAWQRLQSQVNAACLVVPSNLTAVSGVGDIKLTWTGTASASGYHVYRNGVLVATLTAQTLTYDDTSVLNATSYTYSIRAFVGTTESSDSNSVTAMPTLPAPIGFTAMAGDSQVTLNWSAVPGASSYEIFRDGTQIATAPGTMYVDSTAANGTSYSYTIRTVAGTFVSNDSAAQSATPTANTPAAPTGLIATGGVNQVSLSWAGSTGATNYRILRNGTPIGYSTTPAYVDTTPTVGVQYSYTIVALNGSVGSTPSTAATATAVPAAPTGLAVVAGNGTASLTWTSVAGATGYEVFRNGVQIATPTTTSYADSGLTNGSVYTYTVRATAGTVVSADSASQVATPSAPVVLSAPGNVVATPGANQVVLTWTAVTGATSYIIQRDGTQIGTSTTASYTDTTAVAGTQYSYTVAASNGTSTSGGSSPVTTTPVPAAPSGLVATPGNAAVSLTWTAVSGASSYEVFRNGTQVGTSTTASYSDTGLTNGTAYSYTVRTVVGTAVSADSAAQSATPVAPIVLTAPTGLTATGGVGQVALSWTAVTNATGYQILRNGTQIGTSTTASYTDTTAVIGTAYSYTIVATAGSASSSPSAAVTGTAIPAAPTGFVAVAGDTTASLTWTAVTGATGYQVFRNGTQIASPTTASYTDTGLVDGTVYTYTVRTVVGTAVSANSASQVVTPTKPTILATPTGLAAGTATSLNTGAFRLTWTAVTGATGYSIYEDGTLLGTSTTTNYTPASTPLGALHSYTVMATNGTAAQNSAQSAPLSAGPYQGTAVNDAEGRTVYGQIQVTIVVTSAAKKSITGCWATYPTSSDSGGINSQAIPQLCSQALSVQPTSANATTAISNVSGATATSPAFASSLQNALTQAGM